MVVYVLCCRYVNIVSDDVDVIENVQQLFDGYALHGHCTENYSLNDIHNIPLTDCFSLNTQFEILSLVSNDHWWQYRTKAGELSSITSRVGLLSHMSYSATKEYMPTSARNRIISFMVNNSYQQALETVRHLLGYSPNFVASNPVADDAATVYALDISCPPVKRARYAVTVSRSNIEKDLAENKWQTDNSDQMYASFRERLVVEGAVYLRMNRPDEVTFVLNDYDCGNGQFSPFAFVHTTRLTEGTIVYFSCTCSIYNWLQQKASSSCGGPAEALIAVDGLTCMHCRFFKEELETKLSTLVMTELVPDSVINQKLISSAKTVNVGVLLVSPSESSSYKFSVCSTSSSSCSFVNLSKDGRFIHCTSGECRAQRGHRKAAQYVLGDGKKSSPLCPHMEMMRGNAEVWQHLAKMDSADASCGTRPTVDDLKNVEDEGIEVEGKHSVSEV